MNILNLAAELRRDQQEVADRKLLTRKTLLERMYTLRINQRLRTYCRHEVPETSTLKLQ